MLTRHSQLKKQWTNSIRIFYLLHTTTFIPWHCFQRCLHVVYPVPEEQIATKLIREISDETPSFKQRQQSTKTTEEIQTLENGFLDRQSGSSGSAEFQQSLDLRWRQLIFWLNKATKYRIETTGLNDIPLDPSSLKIRISDNDISTLLQDIKKGVFNMDSQRCYFKDKLWPELMVKLLHSHPDHVLDVLEVTTAKSIEAHCLPRGAIADILHCITKHYLQNLISKESTEQARIAIRICHFMYGIPSSLVLPLSNYSSFLLLSKLPRPYLREFYFYISEKHEELSIWTLMQFGSRLAKFGDVDIAFDAVQKLMMTKCHLTRSNTLSVCTSLLHNTRLDPDSQNKTLEIFQYLITSGVEPNVYLYNVILHDTMQNKEPQSAWNFYETMVDKGIEPDVVTYSILLNDAKKRMDSQAMAHVIKTIQQSGKTSKYIVTDIIHAIFLLNIKQPNVRRDSSLGYSKEPRPVFERMLQVYMENFKLDHLFQLIPGFSNICSLPSNIDPEKSLWEPPAATLCVMITGFLGAVDSNGAKLFYEHFRSLVQTGHPAVASLVKTTYVYNAILMCFYKFEDRAKDAPNVVADMLSPNRDTPRQISDSQMTNPFSIYIDQNSETSNSKVHETVPHSPAKPDLYTWSILVKIFMRLRHTRAAEKVLSMMIRRDIKPTIITWTSLISGYARMQNISMTADAVKRLEEAGYESDDFVYRALFKITQQDQLLKAMDSAQHQKIKPVSPAWIDDLNQDLAVDIAEKEFV
ncbi:Pentatricopeptide repeat-containing protein, mitochondrial [Golovinomyces cichoracearum]|uniref:Pentatricopeptide repeat-containing protein, mitochondrial n=1 Tax=Golovinomyces cichoracearum TaxID=62708 RepID=A0A420IBG8_9PEZI|nr:Pentatricopeptide repeat-containing protein, mitochondrial [Golovinomyces cichoracearum]